MSLTEDKTVNKTEERREPTIVISLHLLLNRIAMSKKFIIQSC